MINESDQNLSDTVQGKVKGRKIIGFYNSCQRKNFPNPYDLDYSKGIEITGEQTEEDLIVTQFLAGRNRPGTLRWMSLNADFSSPERVQPLTGSADGQPGCCWY